MKFMVTDANPDIHTQSHAEKAIAQGLEVHARFGIGTCTTNVAVAKTVTEDSQRKKCLMGPCPTQSNRSNQQCYITRVTTSVGSETEGYTYTGREWNATMANHSALHVLVVFFGFFTTVSKPL